MLELETLLRYRSIYSLRLHEILLSRCYKQKKAGAAKYAAKESDGRHYRIEFSLSELKLSLGVVNAESAAVKKILSGSSAPDYDRAVEKASEKSFNTWYEMRRKVIDVAVKEINETDNGMSVTYEPLQAGRGGKVYGVSFFVELTEAKEKKLREKEIKKESLTEDEIFDIQCTVRLRVAELTGKVLSLKEIKAVCDAAEYDPDKIGKACKAAASAGEISNMTGFLITAIQEGYEPQKRAAQKKNKFQNFTQRVYDYDKLEKELLNS